MVHRSSFMTTAAILLLLQLAGVGTGMPARILAQEESPPVKTPAPEDTPKNMELKTNPKLLALKPNEWTLVHEHKGDTPAFAHRGEFGLCFDQKRGRLVMFGCATRRSGIILSNSLFFFDVAKETWSQPYPDDKEDAYRITDKGIAVAGPNGDHPWAAVGVASNFVYIPDRDAVLHIEFDGHTADNVVLKEKIPGLGTDAVKLDRRAQPMWLYSLSKGQWETIPFKDLSFYWRYYNPFVYDPDRKVLIGLTRKGGAIENSPADFSTFAYVARAEPNLYTYSSAVYSPKHKVVFGFGGGAGNSVWVYDIAKKEMKQMPTPGDRPPPGRTSPMVFEPRSGKVVVVVPPKAAAEEAADAPPDGTEATEGKLSTWIYDYERDAWSPLSGKDLALESSCDIDAVYDPLHKVILLVSRRAGREKPKIFALNYMETAEKPADDREKPKAALEKP